MELTVGFISLFLMLVLPGIIFRRFYFLGEFSKQVSISQPLLSTLAYSLIPGVLIQLGCLIGYDTFVETVDGGFLPIFDQLVSNQSNGFNNQGITLRLLIESNFIWYCLSVYVVSTMCGYLCFVLVRNLGLDRRIKILRFKNNWAYIFSGEIMQFHKFKNDLPSPSTTLPNRNRRFLFPHLDVLTRNGGGETTLYTGYLKDYELSHGDINNLEHIYLVDAKRYKRREHKTELVSIPGDFLILPGAEILNINVQYIYSEAGETDTTKPKTISPEEVSNAEEDEEAKKELTKFRILQFYNGLLIILIFSLFIPIFVKFDFLGGEFYDTFMSKPWYKKVLILFALNSIHGILFPFKRNGDEEHFVFRGKEIFILIAIAIFLLGLFYAWAY